MVIGESRSELLNWLNELLQLNYTKVEQCGTGALYCQIMDSIYQDLPVFKLKFDMNGSEYNYLSNFKLLQSCFLKHKISKPIPVERLIKCKFQDNLEFLQWIKKFWMENKDESPYDPIARRSGAKGLSNGRPIGATTVATSRTAIRSRTPSGSTLKNGANSHSNSSSSIGARRVSSQTGAGTGNGSPSVGLMLQVKSLNEELLLSKRDLALATLDLEEYKAAGEGLETERNFYFNKLREIEILTQSIQELIASNNSESNTNEISVTGLLTQIEEILYSTEEGFQVPETGVEELEVPEEKAALGLMILDEETF